MLGSLAVNWVQLLVALINLSVQLLYCHISLQSLTRVTSKVLDIGVSVSMDSYNVAILDKNVTDLKIDTNKEKRMPSCGQCVAVNDADLQAQCLHPVNFLEQLIKDPVHMKRKLCRTSFNCEDMEELNVTALSRRKESAAPLTGERDSTIFRHNFGYPLALVLRLRVLQIVCGISAMVMGSVAFIEERQKFNMGLGIPAGCISVLAAAVSIHTSRGWSAMSGVAGAGAGAASVLWAAAACLLIALVVQCCRTILDPPGLDHGDGPTEEDTIQSYRDLIVIACVQIALAIATLLSAAICARIDCGA